MKSVRKIAIMHCKYKLLVWMEEKTGLADWPGRITLCAGYII